MAGLLDRASASLALQVRCARGCAAGRWLQRDNDTVCRRRQDRLADAAYVTTPVCVVFAEFGDLYLSNYTYHLRLLILSSLVTIHRQSIDTHDDTKGLVEAAYTSIDHNSFMKMATYMAAAEVERMHFVHGDMMAIDHGSV